MKRLVLFPLLTSACVVIDGRLESETFEVGPFSRLENDSFLRVEVEVGADAPAIATCSRRVLDALRLEVRGDTLRIDTRGRFGWLGVPVNCTVEVGTAELVRVVGAGSGGTFVDGDARDVEAIVNTGSGPVEVARASADEVRIVGDGSGGLRVLDLDARLVRVEHDGSGPIRLAGIADAVRVTSDASGATDARDVVAVDAEVHHDGSGPVQVHARRALTGTLTGSGAVHVWGGARVDVDVDGSGRVVVH